MRLLENAKLLWACEPKSYANNAATTKYVSLKNYDHLTIVILTGAWAGGTAAVTMEQATEVAGTTHKALAFSYYWHDETTSGTLAKTAATNPGEATATFNLDTANKLYVLEVNARDLDVANNYDCVTVEVATPGANADFYGVAYILSEPREKSSTPPTALLD